MYIIKNALKSISRSKVRNILIGIIALIIAVSACIALSIKEAAVKTKEDTLADLEITGQISVDRSTLMSKSTTSSTSSSVDRKEMASMFQSIPSLTLDELQTYAGAKSVKDFYYTITSSLNAGDGIEPIDTTGVNNTESSTTTSKSSTSSSTSNRTSEMQGGGEMMPGGMGGGKMGVQGDFTIIGYSSDAAMTNFINSTCTITEGSVFEEGTAERVCLISDELATYNSLSTGDTITLINPNDETETITLTVIGIYNNSASTTTDSNNMMGFSTSTDSANQIYMSYTALKSIINDSVAAAGTTDSTTTTSTTSTAITDQLTGTYVFASVDDYNNFEAEARALGLDDSYSVSSTDLTKYESSLLPLENLSTTATYFLIVIFGIGAVILIILNMFNIRERKYEIGVLTAIGMKKSKVAIQFVCELFIVTFIAIIIGAGTGAVTSVPVTDALLASQIESNTASAQNVQANFGRDSNTNTSSKTSGTQRINSANGSQNAPGGFSGMFSTATDYVSQVSYSTNLTVLLQLIVVGILLTLISSLVSVLFIMRYEPLKILSSRD